MQSWLAPEPAETRGNAVKVAIGSGPVTPMK
jgi:hypothetical protein